MKYHPNMNMEDMDIRTLVFQIEQVAIQEAVPNLELAVWRSAVLDGKIIEMTRRLAVVRKVYEMPEKMQTERVTLNAHSEFAMPATWWDHFKLSHKGLCRWFKCARMKVVSKETPFEFVRVHNHYENVAIVLNDRADLPQAMQTLEIRYESA